MPSDQATELRFEKPSLLLRLIKWLISKRKPVFPHTAAGFHAAMKDRPLPKDAPLPNRIANKHRAALWELEGQKVVTLHPSKGPGEWHMLYFHGGGFVEPMFDVHWPLCAAIAERCGVSITIPLYDVVPEAPASRQDALADAAFAALAGKHDPAKIILNGDSAGGHMALSLALRLAKAGGPQPGKLALFAPWLDLTMADPAMEAIEPHDIMLKIGTLHEAGKMYAGDRDPGSAECSPLYTSTEDLAKLPPTRIWTGRHDLFIIDSRTFVAKLRDAGVDAKLYEYEAAPHVYMAVVPTAEAKDTLALLKDFIET
ncbi:MAG: alpha/beta hydrolase fold domain-containing protein [Erythrobacter sp.]